MTVDPEEEAMRAKAQQFGLDYVGPRFIEAGRDLTGLIPESLARECQVMPRGYRGSWLMVLMSDPNDFETVDRLRFQLNRPIDVALATRRSIREAIRRSYGMPEV